MTETSKSFELATMGGGCYWCLEAFFVRLKGVNSVLSGYSGGTVDNPTAERVWRGDTGHAEVVQVRFEPNVISYRQLLEIFFVMHDPTTLDRQGNDVGDEYRSVIFYHDQKQLDIATAVLKDFVPPLYSDPAVTEVVPLTTFWPADDYMQDYYANNPNQGYCVAIIDPKIQKLRQHFATLLKS